MSSCKEFVKRSFAFVYSEDCDDQSKGLMLDRVYNTNDNPTSAEEKLCIKDSLSGLNNDKRGTFVYSYMSMYVL